jgi:hypothetical protein
VTSGVNIEVGEGTEVSEARIGAGVPPQRLGVEIHPANKKTIHKTLYFFMLDYFNIGIFNP